MEQVLMETSVNVVATLLLTLIGVLGAWLTAKFGKKKELENVNIAKQEAIDMAQQTVLELQQTLVDGWKAANADGKLTPEEVSELKDKLLVITAAKMSAPAMKLLSSAGVDIERLIRGIGESWVKQIKG